MEKFDLIKVSETQTETLNRITYRNLEITKLIIDSVLIGNIEIINCKIGTLITRCPISCLVIKNSAIKKTTILKAISIVLDNSLINYSDLDTFESIIKVHKKTNSLRVINCLVNIPFLKNIRHILFTDSCLANHLNPPLFNLEQYNRDNITIGNRFTMFLNKQEHIRLKQINTLKYLTICLVNNWSALNKLDLTNCDLYQQNINTMTSNYLGKKTVFLFNHF